MDTKDQRYLTELDRYLTGANDPFVTGDFDLPACCSSWRQFGEAFIESLNYNGVSYIAKLVRFCPFCGKQLP